MRTFSLKNTDKILSEGVKIVSENRLLVKEAGFLRLSLKEHGILKILLFLLTRSSSMKRIVGDLALTVGIALVMGTLGGLNHCLDLWDMINRRPRFTH